MDTQYYTAEEARSILKNARSTFFKEVDLGLIPFELEEGRQRNRRYPKRAIDTLAQRGTKKREKGKDPLHLTLTPSTPADLWREEQIGIDLYGIDDIVPFGTLMEWRDINDEIYMNLKDQGQTVGYSSLMPVDENIILALLHDKIREKDIPIEAIRQWTDPQISVYIATVTVKPTGKKRIDTERGGFLIRETVKWALRLNRQFNIKNWYGIGATKEGQSLFERLNFQEIVSLYNGERKGYYINDLRQPTRLVNDLLAEIQREGRAKDKQRSPNAKV